MIVLWSLLGCGAQSTVAPANDDPVSACATSTKLEDYAHIGLSEFDRAEIWWSELAAEAAELFHAEGTPAERRRVFFDTHVYTDRPSLAVELDAFVLTEELALALAADALANDDAARALIWIGRARPTSALQRCVESVGTAAP